MTQAAVQIDLFGNAIVVKQKAINVKHLTMQQMHGTQEDYICRDCVHLIKFNHGTTVYKCIKWKFTPSMASDVNVMDVACSRFVPYDV